MADESNTNDTGTNAPADEIKNLKAEVNRKLSNVEDTYKKSHEQLMAQLAAMQASAAPRSVPSERNEKKLEDLIYENPAEYTRRVQAETESRIEKKLETANRAQQRQNQVLSELTRDFPELQDGDHDFTKLAVEKFNSMAEDMKNSPAAYKTAVFEAALEKGLKPKSKRSTDDGDGYTGSSSSGNARPSRNKSEAVAPETLAFAEAIGMNIKDPKVVDKIKSRVRKNFNRWE